MKFVESIPKTASSNNYEDGPERKNMEFKTGGYQLNNRIF